MKSIDTLVKDIYDLFDPLVEVELDEKDLNVWVGERTPMILYNEYWYDWKTDESDS